MNTASKGMLMAAILTGLAAGAAPAQVPPDIAARIAAIGRVVDPPGTAKIYAPLQKTMPVHGVVVKRDIAYGPGPKDTLDTFSPEAKAKPRPILIFVHGGAFVGGDKNHYPDGSPSPFYDNMMLWAVGHGMVGVNMNYELAPKAQYPVVQQDIAKVVAWTQANIAKSGGDPKKIFLMGFSAGGGHVVSYLTHPEYFPAGGSGLKGAILASMTGGYELAGERPHPYFGDPSTFAERSAKAGLVKSKVPVLITSAEFDPENIVAEDTAAAQALTEAHGPVTFAAIKDHNHLSQVMAFNTADASLSGPVEAFVKGTK